MAGRLMPAWVAMSGALLATGACHQSLTDRQIRPWEMSCTRVDAG